MKKPIANELGLTASSFGTNGTQQLREGQLVSRMLLQSLATGATGVKQARYMRGPTRGSEALIHMRSIIHSLFIVYHCVYVGIGPWHFLFNVRQPAYEIRRGFCTLVLYDALLGVSL